MFINKKTHYLSTSLFLASGIHILANFVLFIVRKIIVSGNFTAPAMVSTLAFTSQIVVSTIMILLMAFVFLSSWLKLQRSLSVVDESDKLQMAVLQQEVMGKDIPALSGESIIELIELWGVILVGVRLVYDICSIVYRRFILDLTGLSSSAGTGGQAFVAIYNNTHGFKYISILTALLLGIFITGIFLHDKLLKMVALFLISIFLLAFVLLGMHTVRIAGYSVGIVWSSIIFHFTETIGLVGLGFYLRKKYIGL